MRKIYMILFSSLFLSSFLFAGGLSIIPKPKQCVTNVGEFQLAGCQITDSGAGFEDNLLVLDEILRDAGITPDGSSAGVITLAIVPSLAGVSPVGQAEAYQLIVTDSAIHLNALTQTGLARGIQTLRQMIADGQTLTVPCCEILDWPSFKIRGQHHDIGRNFIEFNQLKREMDIQALVKVNTFHWHLTDNEGWRIQILSHPELTSPVAQSRLHDKFYTQAQISELVEYCGQRGVNIIPEIDMPGHSAAFERATGVTMQSAAGIAILKDVMTEVCDLFPSEYIHIGADETSISNPDFLPEMIGHVRARGRKIVMWRPGHYYDDDVVYQGWGSRTYSPNENFPMIDSTWKYTNSNGDQFFGLPMIFNSSILQVDEGTDRLLGGIVCNWPERSWGDENGADIFRQNPVYVMMIALAERAWCGGGWATRQSIVPLPDSPMYAPFADFEDRLVALRDTLLADRPVNYIRQRGMEWTVIGPFDNGGNYAAEYLPSHSITGPVTVGGQTFEPIPTSGGSVPLSEMYGQTEFGIFQQSVSKNTAYGETWIWSDTAQAKHMWIQFRLVPRSGSSSCAPAGEWDYQGSSIWLNDQLIPAPDWINPGRSNNPYKDEIYTSRAPTPIQLNQGWNHLFVKSIYGDKSPAWAFTAAVIDWDGQRATEPTGVYYSRDKSSKGVIWYEAEDAAYSECNPATDANASGGAYLIPSGSGSSMYVEWTVDVLAKGDYAVNFQYALPDGENRPLSLTVNGAVVDSSMPFTGSGVSNWISTGTTLSLQAGVNTIRLSGTGSGGPDLDALSIESLNLAPFFTADPMSRVDAIVDAPYSGTIADNASDPESDPMTFSKVSGPAWLSVAANGTLSGTPGVSDLGANVFTVQVSATGGSDTATLNITVLLIPPVAGTHFLDGDLSLAANWDNGAPDVGNDGVINVNGSTTTALGWGQTFGYDGGAAPAPGVKITIGGGAVLDFGNDVPAKNCDVTINNATLNIGDDYYATDNSHHVFNAGSAVNVSGSGNNIEVQGTNASITINGGTHTAGHIGDQNKAGDVIHFLGGTSTATTAFDLFTAANIGGSAVLIGGGIDTDADAIINFLPGWTGSWTISSFGVGDWETQLTSATTGFQVDGVDIDAASFAANFLVSSDGTTLSMDTPANQAPSFTADPMSGVNAIEDAAYSDTIAGSATDPDVGDTLTYSIVSGSAAWLSMAPDGTLSGTPATDDVGANSWTVEVSDGNGGTDQATLNINVINMFTGKMGLVDLQGMASHWLDENCGLCGGANLGSDNKVSLEDFSILAQNWL